MLTPSKGGIALVGVWHRGVLMTEYKYKYHSVWKYCRIRIRIRIRILFSLKKSIEYEYEYYLVWKYRTNTNIIRLEKITRIRIRILVYKVVSYLRKWRFTFYLVPWYNIVNSLGGFMFTGGRCIYFQNMGKGKLSHLSSHRLFCPLAALWRHNQPPFFYDHLTISSFSIISIAMSIFH